MCPAPKCASNSTAKGANIASDDADEVHPLYNMEEHLEEEDLVIDVNIEDPLPSSNVCANLY